MNRAQHDDFDVFLSSEQELEPLPEPGDFWHQEPSEEDDPDEFRAAA
ncbi:hypothetical protein [Adhaeretor mobilis]|uniref:Uncharacterized protein n=1 Tax=Adhaeretor mobilis TaxID=1930276 RepID=A0A517N258_9BACT|nr:hypothetical protein [Adhaeretor mobilis]QDT01240.1 hypothetical protein HG15A2_45820 [Adhaeretor mobilis]